MITVSRLGNVLSIRFGANGATLTAYEAGPDYWTVANSLDDGQDDENGGTEGGSGGTPGGGTPGGSNPGGFIRPIAGSPPISDDFGEHVARGSVNPGTDYAVGKGTAIRAPADGVVKVADNNTGGAGGRVIVIYFDNGWSADFLHLNSLAVGLNQRVSQGQEIAKSGASAYGSENGRGAHLHFSLRNRQSSSLNGAGNVDPELHYG